MDGALNLDLSGIGLRFEGLPPRFVEKMTEDWAPFVSGASEDPAIVARVRINDPDAVDTPFEPRSMTTKIEDGRGVFRLPGGRAVLAARGRVEVELDSATRESYFNLVNLSLACLAVHLPSRGALVIHAACLVVDGRAFVLVGSEGAGKSTWAEQGIAAGAVAVSDDILLLEGDEVLGSPFRSRHLAGEALPGRWSLAAILFPRHGSTARLAPASPLLSHARLAANLPYVSDCVERVPGATALLERLVADVDCRELTFARDPSFVPLLERWE